MIVMKFGGTSVGSADRMKMVAQIVKGKLSQRPLVVVSAMAKITDKLVAICNSPSLSANRALFLEIKTAHLLAMREIGCEDGLLEAEFSELAALCEELGDERADVKISDRIQSFGERMSCKIVACALGEAGVDSVAIPSYDLGMSTTEEFGCAEPLAGSYDAIKRHVNKEQRVIVTTGYIGKTKRGDITTLGRGGSDYSAAIIGAAIDASEIQIWTDVDGVMTADPRIVPKAHLIESLSFEEASELAYFGAKVLHPKTVLPAIEKDIPVRVLNTFRPDGMGSAILSRASKSYHVVKALTCKKNITMITITSLRMVGASGFLARIFRVFERQKRSIDVIATSEVSVSLTIEGESDIEGLVSELEAFAKVEVLPKKSIICVVGEGLRDTAGIIGRIFSAVSNEGINVEMVSQGASKINLTFLVDMKDMERTMLLLHREFFEGSH